MKKIVYCWMFATALSAVASVDETSRWQVAIDGAAAAGGGVVNVPAGEHLVGGLELRSNVELHLEKGATLLAAVGLDHYRIVKYPYSEGDWSAIVMGLNITNAAVTGEGVIHGRGGKWPAPTKEDYKRGHQESLRARGMFFYRSKGIRLEDFTLKDVACWGIVLKECDGIVARKVTIDSHANHNNDGFDIESKNVLIEDCVADSGDDPFVIKSSNPDFVCENITVKRCTARGQANAFKIGMATRGIVRNVRFEDVRCEDATRVCTKLDDGTPTKLLTYHYRCKIGGRTPYGCMLNAICFACVDGGCVEDITVDGLDIAGGVLMPFYVRSDFRKEGRESGGAAPGRWNRLRNIRISNVRGRAMGPVASAIIGTEGFHVENVTLNGIDLEIEGAGEEASRAALGTPVPPPNGHYPSGDQFYPHIFPAYGLYTDRVDGLTLENVRFRLAPDTSDARPAILKNRSK